MDPLRKYDEYEYEEQVGVTYSFGEARAAEAHYGAEASLRAAYQDEITPEALAQLQADANEFLDQDEWTLIDGYDG